jgi:hypothetical protein
MMPLEEDISFMGKTESESWLRFQIESYEFSFPSAALPGIAKDKFKPLLRMGARASSKSTLPNSSNSYGSSSYSVLRGPYLS